MITYHPRKTPRDYWLDVALDGERVGYIIKDNGSAFYEVNITKGSDTPSGFSLFMKAYLTLDLAKQKISEFLGVESEKSQEWADEIN